MADAEIRRLQRDASSNPDDIATLSKLMHARVRTGEQVDTFWKIQHRNGEFCTGLTIIDNYYGRRNNRSYFTSFGKVWKDKTELYRFVKKAVESKNQTLQALLKESEVIEYRTMEFQKESLQDVFEQAEVELLRAEKAELEKKLAEKEKLLAQKEKAAGAGST